MSNYDVIIVGGGPTGVALAIELGLHNIKTLVLEKHAAPLLSPRAQSLNARSMEFFMRWKLHDVLKSKRLLPPDFPIRGVWCSKLNEKTYAVSSSNEQLNDDISPERAIRIPLWLTEEVLRNKLTKFSSITFLKQQSVIDISFDENENFLNVSAKNNVNELLTFSSTYVVGCDGANSITRNKMGIEFEVLAPPRRVINLVFEAPELEKLITVDKGFLYYLLEGKGPGAIGPIDLEKGLWYAQVRDDGVAETIDQVDLHQVILQLTGLQFSMKVIQAHFWNMHIQLAKSFSKYNRVFLVGDSAHAFVPTGGFGLNTGLGDVVNLGWKLAQVIQKNAKPALLESYEQERRPVCLNNLKAAQKNADDMMALQKKYDPVKEPEKFAEGNALLAKQHAFSLGATMGYAYFDSPLTDLQKNQSTQPMENSTYHPTALPGYFLPHVWVENRQSIYSLLSPTVWTLIISSKNAEDLMPKWKEHCQIITLPKNTYPFTYLLIRPDWHISWVGNELSDNFPIK